MIEFDVRLPLASFTLDVRCAVGDGVTALVGASGSGKTSLVELLAGLRRGEGTISIGGKVVLDTARRIELPPERRAVGYVPQDVALFPHLSARDNVTFASRDAARFAALSELLELAPLLDRRPAALSGGERQRVALARALMTSPRVLLLDEPLASIDQPLRTKILTYLRRIRDRERIPMLYVTHSPVEALALSHACIVLDRGRVAAQGDPDRLLRDPRIAGSAGIENVFEVGDPRHDAEKGITRTRTRDGMTLVLPYDQVAGAEFPIVVRISGEDVVVFAREPQAISSRNVFAGEIEELTVYESFGDLVVRTPARIHVRLTRDAIDDLSLHAGMRVWLALRSRAFRVVG